MRIFITRHIPGKALELLKQSHEVDIWAGPGAIPHNELLKRVVGVDAILSLLTEKIDKDVFDAAGSNLKIVANYAVGYDNIDLSEAKKSKIIITNTPGNLGDAVAEMAITLMFALSRRLIDADRWMKSGNYTAWDPDLFLGQDLSGKTIGIVGMGTIGFEVARRADSVFDMQVLYTARSEKSDAAAHGYRFVTLPELLTHADVISIHVPLTEETTHLICQEQFAMMKPTSMLINTARGAVVDQSALYDVLVSKKIWGAAFDVFEHEQTLKNDDVWRKLTQLPNVIMTPHIASATEGAREEMTKMAVENIMAVLAGKPALHEVRESG